MAPIFSSILSSSLLLLSAIKLPSVQAWEGDLPFGNDLGYFECSDDDISRIGIALGNTVTLAASALSLALNNDRANINAYTHYFRTDQRTPPDHKMFEAAMTAAIYSITPPNGNRPFEWKIECVPQAAGTACGPESRAITEWEPNVENPTMFICPSFHTARDTRRTLQEDGICDNARNKVFADFETGGHTLLHELTHFDGFGILATMPLYTSPRSGGVASHGTDDWRQRTTQRLARDLVGNPQGGIDTWRNAENHAAAATEYFFQTLCEIDNIPLTRFDSSTCPQGCTCNGPVPLCS
ncbi:hypothetical protein BKA66DRAFT_569763 [Pyrenochaeta sp. MPI-SDFR-AT-0127]|nr:hypothetical protein BKA66DRAFT_569763 [Pyrenochaeta sp. MPI-SDFR-AT-0127]